MIRLKDVLLEGLFSNPDDRAKHIANHIFGSEHTLTNKRPNPQNSKEIIYTFSNGSDTQHIARSPNLSGNVLWYLRKNDMWEKISVKSIPKPPPSPEELAIQTQRQLNRDKKEKERQEWVTAYQQRLDAERKTFYTKYPNYDEDSTTGSGNPDVDFYIQNSGLSQRKQKILILHLKGYSSSDIADIYKLTIGYVNHILLTAKRKIKQAAEIK